MSKRKTPRRPNPGTWKQQSLKSRMRNPSKRMTLKRETWKKPRTRKSSGTQIRFLND